jgi:hypothetical protein
MQMGLANTGIDLRRWQRCAIAAASSNERNPLASEGGDLSLLL